MPSVRTQKEIGFGEEILNNPYFSGIVIGIVARVLFELGKCMDEELTCSGRNTRPPESADDGVEHDENLSLGKPSRGFRFRKCPRVPS